MFKTRLLSGIILVLIAILLIGTGGDILLLGMLGISVIGMFELYRVFQIQNKLIGIIGYIAMMVYYANLKFNFLPEGWMLLVVSLILMLTVYVFSYPKYEASQVMAVLFGMIYVGVLLSYIYQIRVVETGNYLVWLVFLCSWGSDTCAYCVGMLIGKHKMSPKLSPKKSIEGAVGGVIGAIVLTGIYCMVFQQGMELSIKKVVLLSLGAGVGALISMVGDLAASGIKRNYDIKDYGKLIPGHGGILDRFDSVIITAPIIYYLSFYLL